jgi:hypothetical protein
MARLSRENAIAFIPGVTVQLLRGGRWPRVCVLRLTHPTGPKPAADFDR